MSAVEIPRGREQDAPGLLTLDYTHPRVQELYQLRAEYAARKGWDQAEDPDYYDDGSLYLTRSLAVLGNDDRFRSCLRLTYLDQAKGQLPETCLSIQMLGEETDMQNDAKSLLQRSGVLAGHDSVYDMTRFVVNPRAYSHEAKQQGANPRIDFLTMIGGAVAISDEAALKQDQVVWLFTAESRTVELLESYGIIPSARVKGENDEGMSLEFCLIRPSSALDKVKDTATSNAGKAAGMIKLGKRLVSCV